MRLNFRKPFFRFGDFYRVDDRTGFKTRAIEQKQEWTKVFVNEKSWEYRHPQDFVKGVFDDQTVGDHPRPPPSTTDYTPFVGGAASVLQFVDGVNVLLLVNSIDMLDLQK